MLCELTRAIRRSCLKERDKGQGSATIYAAFNMFFCCFVLRVSYPVSLLVINGIVVVGFVALLKLGVEFVPHLAV